MLCERVLVVAFHGLFLREHAHEWRMLFGGCRRQLYDCRRWKVFARFGPDL